MQLTSGDPFVRLWSESCNVTTTFAAARPALSTAVQPAVRRKTPNAQGPPCTEHWPQLTFDPALWDKRSTSTLCPIGPLQRTGGCRHGYQRARKAGRYCSKLIELLCVICRESLFCNRTKVPPVSGFPPSLHPQRTLAQRIWDTETDLPWKPARDVKRASIAPL